MWRSLPLHERAAQFNAKIFRGIWKYAAAVSANAIIGVILTQIDKVILSRMLTLSMFGYYSLAATVGSAIWMIILPFNNAVFPRFVQLHEAMRTEELRLFFHRSSQFLSLILFPVCALIIVFSDEIMSLWLHDPAVVKNCYLIASLLVFGTMLNGIASVPGYSASAFGWPQLLTYTNLIQAVVFIPLIVALVRYWGGVGAGLAWVALNSTFVIFMVPVYFRRYLRGDAGSWYFRDIARPAVAAFTVCYVSLLLRPGMQSRLANSSWLIATGAISLCTTALSLAHCRDLLKCWFRSCWRSSASASFVE